MTRILWLMRLREFQSTLPAGGATNAESRSAAMRNISIHAPRGGSDNLPERKPSPAGSISIHAPRGGSDVAEHQFKYKLVDFNPRSPRGERRQSLPVVCTVLHFNPRSPRGERRQPGKLFQALFRDFNPRSPRGERQQPQTRQGSTAGYFNPRSPRGERLI